MLRSRAWMSLGLLLLLLGWGVPRPAAAQGAGSTGRTVDARQLLAIARGGLTAVATAAGPQRSLASGLAKNRPFWTAVDAMGRSLDAVQAAFLARDPAFFSILSTGSRNLAELKAVWAHLGVDSPSVVSGLETLSSAYLLLRGSYGWEAVRQQQGGALTTDEARRLQALQQAQAGLARRLATVRAQAARAGDRQAAADLDCLIAQARAIAAADSTLAAYLAALQSAEALQGEWAGDSRYVKPAARKAWRKAAPLVEDLTTDSGVGFVFTTDLSQADGWAPLQAPVEVPAGVELGPEVAVLGTTAGTGGTGGTDPAGIPPAAEDTPPAVSDLGTAETEDGEEAESAEPATKAPPAAAPEAAKKEPAPAPAASPDPASPTMPLSPAVPAPSPAPAPPPPAGCS
jgi:hypothetical protein